MFAFEGFKNTAEVRGGGVEVFEGSYKDFRITIYTETSDVLIPTVMRWCWWWW